MISMDRALSEVMQDIEDLHKRYNEQEQVIKDRDNFIGELLNKIQSEDTNGDSNDDGDNDGCANEEDSEENPEVVSKGAAPQE
jgi:hypothetical protein